MNEEKLVLTCRSCTLARRRCSTTAVLSAEVLRLVCTTCQQLVVLFTPETLWDRMIDLSLGRMRCELCEAEGKCPVHP